MIKTVEDLENLIRELDPKHPKGEDRTYMLYLTAPEKGTLNEHLKKVFSEGAVAYGNFSIAKENNVPTAFTSITIGGYTFHIFEIDKFSQSHVCRLVKWIGL